MGIDDDKYYGYISDYRKLKGWIYMCKYHIWKIKVTGAMLKLLRCCESRYLEIFEDDFYHVCKRKITFKHELKYSSQRLKRFKGYINELLAKLSIQIDPFDAAALEDPVIPADSSDEEVVGDKKRAKSPMRNQPKKQWYH